MSGNPADNRMEIVTALTCEATSSPWKKCIATRNSNIVPRGDKHSAKEGTPHGPTRAITHTDRRAQASRQRAGHEAPRATRGQSDNDLSHSYLHLNPGGRSEWPPNWS